MKALSCPIDYFEKYKDEDFYKVIPEERLKKANNFKFEKDRLLSHTASFLFYKVFTSCKGCHNEAIPIFSYNEHKKPYLKEFPDFKFNLSHSGKIASIVYGDEECGIDIQKHSKMGDALINRFLNKDEYRAISFTDDELAYFANMAWCIKEAYIKFIGMGLSYDMRNCRVEFGDGELLQFKKMHSKLNSPEYIDDLYLLGKIVDINNEYPVGYFKYFIIKYYETYHLAICLPTDEVANCSHLFMNE